MAPPIDAEPVPRPDRTADGPLWPTGRIVHRFGATHSRPQRDFFDVLVGRRSRSGEDLPLELVGTILRCATQLRFRQADGRFGAWESRNTPSAGGIHGMRFLVVPVGREGPAGIYEPDLHALIEPPNLAEARRIAARTLSALRLPCIGWLAQLVVDTKAYSSRYDCSNSLILRDAGALCCTVSLTAEAFGAWSRLLGHLDLGMTQTLELGARYAGVGGVHLTGAVVS